MSLDNRRMTDAARELVCGSPADRKSYIDTDRFIPHKRAQLLLEDFEAVFTHPPTHRKPNRLLLGDSNSGKTMLIERFMRSHPPNPNPEGTATIIPVLNVLMPPTAKARQLYIKILSALGAKHAQYAKTSDLAGLSLRLMKEVGMGMLIIDEFHNVMQGRLPQRVEMLNVVRDFSNELRIPIIACGTRKALNAITYDEQLANRFKPVPLPRWRPNKETSALLNSLETSLPLKNASNLSEPTTMRLLLTLSEGTIGELIGLVRISAKKVVDQGGTHITQETIKSANYTPPSLRKANAERILGVQKS